MVYQGKNISDSEDRLSLEQEKKEEALVKKLKRERIFVMFLCLVMVGSVVNVPGEIVAAKKKTTHLELNTESNLLMSTGQTKKIKVIAVKPKGSSKKVKFKSSNVSVVKVSSKGVMKARKSGKAVITVTSVSNRKVSEKIKVTVKTAVKKITLNKTKLTLKEGEEFILQTTVKPKSAEKVFSYKSSKPSVATVSEIGKITAKKAGTAKITVTAVHGKKKAICTVKVVKKDVPVSTIVPSKAPLEVPTAVPSTPTAVPSTPTAVPSTPTAVPSTPTAVPSTPTAVPSTPTAVPSTPTAVPSTPTAEPTATPVVKVDQIFDTVEDLKATNLEIGKIVQTKGYWQVGDNGAATYEIMTYDTWYSQLPKDILQIRPESTLINTPVDEYGNHTLSNGLVAKLIGTSHTPEQWGAKDGANLMPFIHMFAQVKTGRIDFMENKVYELELIAKDNPYRWYMCGGLLGGQYFYKPIMGNVKDLVLDGHNCTITIPDGKFGDSGMGVLNFCRNIENLEIKNFTFDGKGHTITWGNKNSNHLLFYAPGSSFGATGDNYEPAKVENWKIHNNVFNNPGAMYSKAGDWGGDCILVINPDALDGLYIDDNEFYNWGRWVFAIDLGGNGERLYNLTFNRNKCIGANGYLEVNEDGTFKYLNEAPKTLNADGQDAWRWRALGLIDFEAKKCFTNVEMKDNYILGTGGWAINGNSKVSENIHIENNYWNHVGGGYPYRFEFYSGFAKDLIVKNNTLLGTGGFKLGVFTHNLTFENNIFNGGCRSFGLAGDIIFRGNKKVNADAISTLWSHESNIFYDGQYLTYDQVKNDVGVNIVFKDNDAFFNGIFTDMNDLDKYSYMKFDVDIDKIEIWKTAITAFGIDWKINPDAFTSMPQDMYIHGVEITKPFKTRNGLNSIVKVKAGQTVVTDLQEGYGVLGGYFFKNLTGIENFQSYNNWNWGAYASRHGYKKLELVCTQDGYMPGTCEYGFRYNATHISYVLDKDLTLQDHAYVWTDDTLYYSEKGGKLTKAPVHTEGTVKDGETELTYIGKIAKVKLVTE